MKVINYNSKKLLTQHTLILGGFESFHNGHLKLIEEAKKLNTSVALMMIKNPNDIPGSDKLIYASLNTRIQQAASIGIDVVVLLDLTPEILVTKGENFLKRITNQTKAKHIIVGHDFAFGKGKEIDSNKLKKMWPNTTIVSHKKINNQKISTSLLKELVTNGEFSLIYALSPFHYTIETRIDSNNKVTFKKFPMPNAGVYAAFTIVNEIKYWSIVSVDINGVTEIITPDLNIKNASFNAKIIFIDKVRTYIKLSDKPTAKDKSEVINLLEKSI